MPASRHIAHLVTEIAQRTPDHPAVVAAGQTITYGELDAAAARRARHLAQLGVRRHMPVGLLCTNRLEWIETALAAFRLGAPVAAFDTWSRAWDLEFLIAHSDIEVLVTLDEFRGHRYIDDLRELVPELDEAPPGAWRSARFPRLRHVEVIGAVVPHGASRFAEARSTHEQKNDTSGVEVSSRDVAFVLFTSGTTARPKAVPLIHASAIENGFNIGERMRLTQDDRVWVPVPLFWSYGSANAAMATFTHGATLVLQEVFDAGEALEVIEINGCTACYILPNITAALVEHPQFTPQRVASLRTGLTIGNEQEIRRAAEVLGVSGICNVYGSTETYGNCAVTATTDPLDLRATTQGTPLPGMQIRIVDRETGGDAPPGEPGEVWVAGHVATEYVGNRKLSRRAFVDGFYRTGDVGLMGSDGRFRFIGRASEMIKTGGINVSPVEVETFLATHPAVRTAGVVGVSDERAGQIVVAFVELIEGLTATPEELKAVCKAGMADYKVPREIVICANLPRTATGKLSRTALKDPGAMDTLRATALDKR